uniref:Uncharacterized protein n=1 Tax=Rhodococcus sp. NS1 TaxID=402236 RepID=A0A097SQE6_9NOCA|nr:hypothetical protein LRS1606.317 [Rhodococcus sp. NS1]
MPPVADLCLPLSTLDLIFGTEWHNYCRTIDYVAIVWADRLRDRPPIRELWVGSRSAGPLFRWTSSTRLNGVRTRKTVSYDFQPRDPASGSRDRSRPDPCRYRSRNPGAGLARLGGKRLPRPEVTSRPSDRDLSTASLDTIVERWGRPSPYTDRKPRSSEPSCRAPQPRGTGPSRR